MKKFLMFVFPVAALLLELLPRGVEMRFGNPDGAPWVYYYSYFSLLPVGYAKTAPFLTGVMTVVLIALLAVAMFRAPRGLRIALAAHSAATALMSALALIWNIVPIAVVICCILLAQAVLSWRYVRAGNW